MKKKLFVVSLLMLVGSIWVLIPYRQAVAVAADLPEMTILLGASAAATHEGWPVTDLHLFSKAVETRSNGKIKMPVFVAGELGLQRESTPVAVKNGLIQMAYVSCGHIAGTFSHLNVFALPFLMGSVNGPLPDANKMADAVNSVTVREFARMGVAPALFWIESPTQLISKGPLDNVANMKGFKCRAWDESTSDIVKRLNGVPVIMGVGETYLAMQRGVVDGVLTGAVAMIANSLPEISKHLYMVNLPPSADYLIYNEAWFKRLPKEYQVIVSEEWANLDKLLDRNQPIENQKALDKIKAAGVAIHELRPEEKADIIKAVKPVWDVWADRQPVNREVLEAAKKALGL